MELNSVEIAICNAAGNLNFYDKKNKELFEACRERNFMKIKKAVENGADINGFDENGDTPLALVIESNIPINDCSSSLEAEIQAHKIKILMK